MPFSPVITASGGSSDGNNVSTTPVDTTGVTFFLKLTTWKFDVGTPTTKFSDDKGNIWIPIGSAHNLSEEGLQWAYCNPTSVGANHIFQVASAGCKPSCIIFGFSGGTGQLINFVTGGGGSGGSTVAGPINLSGETDVLFAGGLCINLADTPTVNSPFTGLTNIPVTANHYGATAAYEIQTASINRTVVWTFTVPFYGAAYLVAFRAIAPVNDPPVADAGPDQNLVLATSTVLAGSATDDGLPGPLTYVWSKISGPAIIFDDATDPETGITITQGTYVLRLTVSDGSLTDFDEMTIINEDLLGDAVVGTGINPEVGLSICGAILPLPFVTMRFED